MAKERSKVEQRPVRGRWKRCPPVQRGFGACKHTYQISRIPLQAYSPNIADSEVLNGVSQIVLKIDFVFVIGTTTLLSMLYW